MLLGGLVGMERQTSGRSAGLRTNILVCLGSTAIIVAFQKLFIECNMGAESVVRMDPSRAAAGVITGIGFLGAGTIVKSKDFVRGLTTAASIWVVSAIGVTVGLGEYVIAVFLTMLVLVSLYALHRLPISADHYFSLHLKWHGDLDLLDEMVEHLIKQQVHIKSRSVMRHPKTGACQVVLRLRMRALKHDTTIIDNMLTDDRFDEVSWN
jgi:putative Mg2+ transporter-C (MgtC) family protein